MSKSAANLDMQTYNATREAVSEDPEKGQGSFEAVTEWSDGAIGVTRARSFEIKTDEPEALGGKDSAIDPMELILGALGSCLTIGWVTHANKHGVDFRHLKVTVKAPFDLRGYLGVDKAVRPGFSALEYEVQVDTDADDATLAEIKEAAAAGSPVLDNILNETPISGTIFRT